MRSVNISSSVYFYNETESEWEIYLGECSTIEGLSLFSIESKFKLTSFGATCYKDYGWATEEELPNFSTVADVILFLNVAGDIGIIEFEAQINESVVLRSHDDGECHFRFISKHECMAVLQKVIQPQNRGLLINKLLNNPGSYITCNADGILTKYDSFDQYLTKNR